MRSVRLGDYEIRTKQQAWELLRPYLPAPIGGGVKPLDRHTIRLILDDAARRAGVGHVHPHMLRHSFATHLRDDGAMRLFRSCSAIPRSAPPKSTRTSQSASSKNYRAVPPTRKELEKWTILKSKFCLRRRYTPRAAATGPDCPDRAEGSRQDHGGTGRPCF